MPNDQNVETVKQLEKRVRESKGVIVTSFKGVKTVEFNEMRQRLRPLHGDYHVVKNSLTRIALRNAGMAALADMLEGPTAVVLERGDAIATTKAVFDFIKTHENVKVQGGYFDGKVVGAQELKAIAALPSKDVLLSQLLGTLQAPLVNLVSVLQAPVRDLVSVLNQVATRPAEQK